MLLKKVTLRNFRCFEELSVDLHPSLTVLVAENGGGKTAILDGIAIGLSSVLRYLSSADQRLKGPGIKDTDIRLLPNAERSVASPFTQVVVETDAVTWDVSKTSARDQQPPEKIGKAKLSEYCAKLLESIKTSRPKLLPVFAYYGAKRGWIEVPARLHKAKGDSSFPTSALVGALDALADFKEMLKWFDVEEASELRANRDTAPADRQLSKALESVRAAIVAILGGAFENPHFNPRHKFVIDAKDKTGKVSGQLQVSQLSQGYQAMLALGMDFARRLSLANGDLCGEGDSFPTSTEQAPAIMLVDEIDLHLHPSWQQRVLSDLRKAFPKTQLIVTTHSPQVISTVPAESIRIIHEGKQFAAPPGTDGAEAQRVLEQVFQVAPRAKEMDKAKKLEEYLRLVDQRLWDSQRAIELRRILDDWSQGHEPRLLEADLQIENLKWESGR